MRYLICLLLLASCTVSETGSVSVQLCPNCSHAFDGFENCAFFDADPQFAKTQMLIDDQNYEGVGWYIKQDGYMHHKFCFNSSHAVTGSANPTANGLTMNQNILARFESDTMAKNFATEYAFLKGQGTGNHKEKWNYNGKEIQQYFCPRDSCEEKVIAALQEAKNNITFIQFSFTADKVGNLLMEKKAQGVAVRGVLEPRSKNLQGSEFSKLTEYNIPIATPNTPGVIHTKAFVIDDKVAIFGSYNPSKNADTRNAETIIITQEPKVIEALLEQFDHLVDAS